MALPSEVERFLGNDFDSYKIECNYNETDEGLAGIVDQAIEKMIRPKYSGVKENLVKDYIMQPLIAGKKYNEKHQDIVCTIYISDKSFVASFYNGTDILKRQDIKDRFENRKLPCEIIPIDNEDQCNINFLFLASDMIHVDKNEGVIYFGMQKEGAVI